MCEKLASCEYFKTDSDQLQNSLRRSQESVMSNRLNVVFHDEQTDDAYCLLHLRWFDIDDPIVPRLLRSLISAIGTRWARPSESISALAAQIVISLGSQVDADLLPASSPWLAGQQRLETAQWSASAIRAGFLRRLRPRP